MVRWRCSLLLALLLLVQPRIGGKLDDEEEEEAADDEGEDNESEDEDDTEDPSVEKSDSEPRRRLGPGLMLTPKTIAITRTTSKRPLECYVCAYKIDSQIKSCLDPTKHRVHTMTCHSMEDKCFTTVMTKNSAMEGLVRGCRSGCIPSPETTCCEVGIAEVVRDFLVSEKELNRCNNQAFAMPIISPRALPVNKTTKSIPTTVLFFVTILLVLQTVVKVAFV